MGQGPGVLSDETMRDFGRHAAGYSLAALSIGGGVAGNVEESDS
jgi:hypothetical protein